VEVRMNMTCLEYGGCNKNLQGTHQNEKETSDRKNADFEHVITAFSKKYSGCSAVFVVFV
jgi:hypothetical protein